ncbi:MAG: hypothetical protein WD342_15240 [Verrucomicrobiales bacterium]
MNKRESPPFTSLLIPLAVLALGFTLAGMYGSRRIPELLQVTARGVVPPGFVGILGEKRSYTLWLGLPAWDLSDKPDVTSYLPPGAEISIIDLSSGDEIELADRVAVTRNTGGERMISLGKFESERVGQQIQLKGTGISEPVTMSIAPTNLGQVLTVSLTLLGIIAASVGVAVFLFYFLLGRRQRKLDAAESV